jgi:hypothetical protein
VNKMKLKDLFTIKYGQKEYHSKNHLDEVKNGVPLISSKGSDRGIYGYFEIKPKYNHVISVPSTGTICKAYYQEDDCCIDDNCLVLTPKKQLTKKEMIYFSLIIRKERFKFMYGRQVTPYRLGNTEVKNLPSWIKINNKIDYSNINKSALSKNISLTNRKWEFFKLIDLFEIKKGERLTKENRIEGKIPLITATSENNGVVQFINLEEFEKVKKIFENKITIDMFFNVFYHQYSYFSDDNVHTLIPKHSNNKYISLFLVSVLNKLREKYNYGRQVRLSRLNSELISLPVNKKNLPDWNFMEDYIKSINYSSAL